MSSNKNKICCNPFSFKTHSGYLQKLNDNLLNKLRNSAITVPEDSFVCDTCKDEIIPANTSSESLSSETSCRGGGMISQKNKVNS